MNSFTGSGRLIKNAVVNDTDKVVKLTIATTSKFEAREESNIGWR